MNTYLYTATVFRVLFRNLKQGGVGAPRSDMFLLWANENYSAANEGANGCPKPCT